MSNPSYILEAFLPGAADAITILIDRKRYDLLKTDFIREISLAGASYTMVHKSERIDYSTITPALMLRVKLTANEKQQPSFTAPAGQGSHAIRKVPGQGNGKCSGAIPDLAA